VQWMRTVDAMARHLCLRGLSMRLSCARSGVGPCCLTLRSRPRRLAASVHGEGKSRWEAIERLTR
jgi:hypothetical protein